MGLLRETLAFVAEVAWDDRANTLVKETIDRLELGEIRNSIDGSLAHGQRQMVELGMVVAAEPWLVLLDEPQQE